MLRSAVWTSKSFPSAKAQRALFIWPDEAVVRTVRCLPETTALDWEHTGRQGWARSLPLEFALKIFVFAPLRSAAIRPVRVMLSLLLPVFGGFVPVLGLLPKLG